MSVRKETVVASKKSKGLSDSKRTKLEKKRSKLEKKLHEIDELLNSHVAPAEKGVEGAGDAAKNKKNRKKQSKAVKSTAPKGSKTRGDAKAKAAKR